MVDDAAAPGAAPKPSDELAAAAAAMGGPAESAGAAPGGGAGVTDQAAPAAGESRPGAVEAALLARMGVDWIAAAVTRQYPVLSYPEATRERAAQLAGAVMAKHDLFGWLKRWREEFELGVFLAGVAWQSYQLVKNPPAAPSRDGSAPAAPGSVTPAA